MIYTPPSRPKGRSRTGNLPVRVVFYGFFCRHGDKAPLFCFVRRMISAQAAKGGRPAGEPPLCSLWFPALSLRAVPAGRQKHLPRSRFHGGAPFLPCPRRAPALLRPLRAVPYRAANAASASPRPFFRASLSLARPRRASPPPCVPLRTVPCEAAGAASRKPASMARFPSLACRAAHLSPCTAPSGCALQGGKSGLPRSRSYGAPPLHACRAAHPLSPASPSDCALRGSRSGLRKPASMTRFPSHARRAAPDPAGGPPAPSALPHRFGNFYSKPHLREKAGCACIVYKSSCFGYSRLHENSERFFTNSENLVSLYFGSRPALHGSAERPARRRTYRQRPTCRPHRERREKRGGFLLHCCFFMSKGE